MDVSTPPEFITELVQKLTSVWGNGEKPSRFWRLKN